MSDAIAAAIRAGTHTLCGRCGGTGVPPPVWLAASYCPNCKGSGVVPVPPPTRGRRGGRVTASCASAAPTRVCPGRGRHAIGQAVVRDTRLEARSGA